MPQGENNKGVVERNDYESTNKPQGENYLLVIGIDEYAHCPRLYNAVKDAQDIVQVLVERFQFEPTNIKTLYNQVATKANIYQAFEYFADKVTPKDNFLLYFSGHGEFKKLFKLGYWIPVEAKKEATHEFIPNSEVKNILSAIQSHHTFLMADSCFSGSLFSKGTGKNISLRKERDPSRWGLTAGRNEIVTDGTPGQNSPFAESILYEFRNANGPIGVAELCYKVLEVVTANADQTPRGEPLKIDGHRGGQFVFHLKMDEAADWKNALATNTVATFQAFVAKYPDSENDANAKGKIKAIQASNLWQQIEKAKATTSNEVNHKLQFINQFVDKYEDQVHYDEALNIGELLEYKKQFFQAKNSEFALRRFLRKPSPNIEGAGDIKKMAQAQLTNWDNTRMEEEESDEIVIPSSNVKDEVDTSNLEKIEVWFPENEKAGVNKKLLKNIGLSILLLPLIALFFWFISTDFTNRNANIVERKQQAHDKAWTSAKKTNTIADYEAYQKKYPSGKYYNDATSQIRKLKAIVTNINLSTFKDTRDGQTYKWVRLKDGKKWMAENLNYEISDSSWCYDDKSSNCVKYGRLYTWQAAKRACPSGWRLPTDDEWWKLASYYGKACNSHSGQAKKESSDCGKAAYKALVIGGDSRFSVLFGGRFNSNDGFNRLGTHGGYWTISLDQSSSDAWYYYFRGSLKSLYRGNEDKSLGFSCRCLKDESIKGG